MKRFILLALAIAPLVTACTKIKTHKLEDTIVEGNWKVIHIDVDNVDISYFFENYSIDFSKDGAVVATDGKHIFNGTWKVSKDNIDEDMAKETLLTITYSHESSFDELNHSWEVVALSDARIELQDHQGTHAGDELTMVRK
jgi:hypothetical protein